MAPRPQPPPYPPWPGSAAARPVPAMKTRSPDLAAAGATGVPSLTCMNVVRAIATPAEAQLAWVSEEQSQELGPLDPYTYGLPSWASANAAARFPAGDPVSYTHLRAHETGRNL